MCNEHPRIQCGKSAIIKAVAEQFNLKVIDQRLSQSDPTDLNGFPRIKDDKAEYVPFDTFPTEHTPLPLNQAKLESVLQEMLDNKSITQKEIDNEEPAWQAVVEKCYYDGWLLFLDEFNSAPLAVQASAYKLVLDHEIGQLKLHENLAIACAGNLESDNAIVNTVSTAMQSRVIHIPMMSDAEVWDSWAVSANVSYQIRDFVKYKGDAGLNNFNPEATEETFGCERTWEFADKLLKVWGGNIPADKLQLLAGTIGMGLAQEFNSYIKVYKEIPTYADIIADPLNTTVPVEQDRKFAITGVIGHSAKAADIGKAMDYILRLPLEFQVITLRDVIKKDPAMANDPATKSWVQKNMNSLF